jgi:filamentous hemagglutinin
MSPLEKMAHSIHGESLKPGGSARAFNSETVAVAVLEDSSGERQTVAASSRGRMSRAQTVRASALGISPINMPNVSGPGGHAEVNIINRYAEANNMRVVDIAASRPICCYCNDEFNRHGATPYHPINRKSKR